MSEWIAFIQVRGGLPQDRSEYMSGQISAVLANIHRKTDAAAFSPSDFIPRVQTTEDTEDETAETQETIDLQETSRALERMLGKRIEEK